MKHRPALLAPSREGVSASVRSYGPIQPGGACAPGRARYPAALGARQVYRGVWDPGPDGPLSNFGCAVGRGDRPLLVDLDPEGHHWAKETATLHPARQMLRQTSQWTGGLRARPGGVRPTWIRNHCGRASATPLGVRLVPRDERHRLPPQLPAWRGAVPRNRPVFAHGATETHHA